MINIAMVNHGNYLGRGGEYVHKLCDAINRHTSLTEKIRWTILSEADTPDDVHGWWAKMYLFQPGLFPAGERVVYLDLDTLVVDNIDWLAGYRGPLAMLQDFLNPNVPASGVMAWTSGQADFIWQRWRARGRPMPEEPLGPGCGDGGVIAEACMDKELVSLQATFPGKIVSLKVHCGSGLPAGASLVCFHGEPRPHKLAELMRHW